jgi:hypothetical protein
MCLKAKKVLSSRQPSYEVLDRCNWSTHFLSFLLLHRLIYDIHRNYMQVRASLLSSQSRELILYIFQAFCRDPGPGNQPYSLEGLHDFAQEVLKETRENPSDPEVILPPGFDLAFDIYPQAHALTYADHRTRRCFG